MDDTDVLVDGPFIAAMKSREIVEELCRVDHVALPEELTDAFADTFVEYLRVVLKGAKYLYGDNPTPEQCRAAIWLMNMQSQKRLEDNWGGPLP